MKKSFLLIVAALLLYNHGYSQATKSPDRYLDGEGIETAPDKAVERIRRISGSNGGYTVEKFDLKNKRVTAIEKYNREAQSIGVWKIYDTRQKKERTISFDAANQYIAAMGKSKADTLPPVIDIGSPGEGSSEHESIIPNPPLKPGRYKTFTDYFNSEFYLSEEIQNYLNEVQSINIRAIFTIDSRGKITELEFRPRPGKILLPELCRVFLNAPELLSGVSGKKAKGSFSIKMRIN